MANDDRAEAWFEIRYNSNASSDSGLANRRYRESDQFDLYDENLSAIGAKGAFRMFTRHKEVIVGLDGTSGYESQFPPPLDAQGNSTAIAVQLADAKTFLTTNFGESVGIDGDILVGEDQSTLYFRNTDVVLTLGKSVLICTCYIDGLIVSACVDAGTWKYKQN